MALDLQCIWTMRSLCLALLIIFVTPNAWGATRAKPSLMGAILSTVSTNALVRVQKTSPPLSALHHAALRHAGLADRDDERWARRSKWAAAMPRLQVGIRQNLSDDLNLHLDDTVSVSGSGVVIGPRASDFTQRSDRNFQLDVRALWNLNELVFSPDTVFISREARERRREISAILHEANQLFTQWQALQAWMLAPDAQIPITMVVQQQTFVQAELDALTGGWFSENIRRIP